MCDYIYVSKGKINKTETKTVLSILQVNQTVFSVAAGLLPSTGIAFVARKGEKKSLPMKLLNVVFEAWPVLIVMFLLAILAGILIWAMVRKICKQYRT